MKKYEEKIERHANDVIVPEIANVRFAYGGDSDLVDETLTKIMSEHPHNYQVVVSEFEIVIKSKDITYKLWNANKYYAWLKECTVYERHRSEAKSHYLWSFDSPSKIVMSRFYRWMDKQTIVSGGEHYHMHGNDEIFYNPPPLLPEELFRMD